MVFFIGMRIATLFCSVHTFRNYIISTADNSLNPPSPATEVVGGGIDLTLFVRPVCGHDFVHA